MYFESQKRIKIILCSLPLAVFITWVMYVHARKCHQLISNSQVKFPAASNKLSNLKKLKSYASNTSSIDVAITVLTFERRHSHFRENMELYNRKQKSLTSLMDQLSLQLLQRQLNITVALSACNIDSNPTSHVEAIGLSNQTTVFNKPFVNNRVSIPETDRENYVFCLNSTLRTFFPRYVVVLQDDVMLHENFMRVLNQEVRTHLDAYSLFHNGFGRNYTAYINFNQSNSPQSKAVLITITTLLIAALLLSLVTLTLRTFNVGPSTSFLWIKLFIYLVSLCIVANITVKLTSCCPYSLVKTTRCYTEAVLYPSSFTRRLVVYLDTITVDYSDNFTSAVQKFADICDLHGYTLCPSIVSETPVVNGTMVKIDY